MLFFVRVTYDSDGDEEDMEQWEISKYEDEEVELYLGSGTALEFIN